jgi:DNA (cytosine-5)-methyltransferase 1
MDERVTEDLVADTGMVTEDGARVGAAWARDASERSDFQHRPRVFPPALSKWRKALVEALARRASVGDREEVTARLRAALDDGLVRLRDILRVHEVLEEKAEVVVAGGDAERTVMLILDRIGVFRELERDLAAVGAAASLDELLPASLRAPLRRHLPVLEARRCHEQGPECGSCEVRDMCRHARCAAVQAARRSAAPTVVDLFSGAGGVSEGFVNAGFRVLAALDQNEVALRTYRFNHPSVPDDRVLARDIRETPPAMIASMLDHEPVDVLIGAPPCQGFSQVGFRSKPGPTGYKVAEDARNYLFEHVVRAADVLNPRLLLLENVPGMESARRESVSFLDMAAAMLNEHGFRTAIWRLNSSAFGVPQSRQRCFLIATRGRLLPPAPPQEYQELGRGSHDIDALPPVTLDEAIFDLPPRQAGQGEAIALWDPTRGVEDPRARRYLRKFRLLRTSRVLYNHAVRYHNDRDLELYALLQPGEDSVHALERYQRSDLMRYRSDVFDDKYSRLRGDKSCRTIVSHLAKDGNGYIHPTQVRSITVREAARVQSFRDDYAFCGSPSDQWIQVGNAVPPLLAQAIARSFLNTLRRDQR